jgi:hypothetical protein
MSGVKRGLHSISGLFAFALVGLFALCALMIVVSGVQSYRSMGRANQLSSQERIALGYVSGKLRASGDRDGVSIREDQGIKLLVLSENEDGVEYETRIFFDGGSLYEQFSQADLSFDPEGGEPIATLPGFSFERSGDLVTLHAVLSDGIVADACVALRAGEGGGQDAL